MIGEQELRKRDWLSFREIEGLMEGLGVTRGDIAEACELSVSTLNTYWGQKLPQKHFPKIIKLFRSRYRRQQSGPNGESAEPSETDEQLRHLVPDRIIFRPKNGLAEALQEAAEIADEQRAKVYVRAGQRLISISVEGP